MILLVCGGREFNDIEKLDRAMVGLPFTPTLIVEGGARGADTLAKLWATSHGIHYAEVPALWDFYDKRAGSLRNRVMVQINIDYCLAMPGGTGTQSMVRLCRAKDVPTWEPYTPTL